MICNAFHMYHTVYESRAMVFNVRSAAAARMMQQDYSITDSKLEQWNTERENKLTTHSMVQWVLQQIRYQYILL